MNKYDLKRRARQTDGHLSLGWHSDSYIEVRWYGTGKVLTVLRSPEAVLIWLSGFREAKLRLT